LLDLGETPAQHIRRRVISSIVLRGVQNPDRVQRGRGELDPGAVARALQRIGRMQRRTERVFEVFANHRRFENRRVADAQQGRFAERRQGKEPVGLGIEIDVDAFEGGLLFREGNDGALHVGA
jgi:hypothetical protein